MASLSLHPGKASPGCPRLCETGRRPAELAAASKTLRVSSHARTVLGRNPGCFGFVSAGSKAWPFTTPVLGGTNESDTRRAVARLGRSRLVVRVANGRGDDPWGDEGGGLKERPVGRRASAKGH